MGCELDQIAEHLVVHEILGTGSGGGGSTTIRRDVIANIGAASDYQKKWFLEDRSLLATESDVLYLSMYDGAAWVWVTVITAPPNSGGGPW